MFSARSQVFMCPADWLLIGSACEESMYNFSLKLITVCVSMEGSAERRHLQSERINDRLSCHKFCAWDKQVFSRISMFAVCASNSEFNYLLYYPVGVFLVTGFTE